eukprot:COSAG01_NODE_11637_length_1891_cov_8.332031_1_plen_348_part_10
MLRNGICDSHLDCAARQWDQGDCTIGAACDRLGAKIADCSRKCMSPRVADKVCDGSKSQFGHWNCSHFHFDHGDCGQFNAATTTAQQKLKKMCPVEFGQCNVDVTCKTALSQSLKIDQLPTTGVRSLLLLRACARKRGCDKTWACTAHDFCPQTYMGPHVGMKQIFQYSTSRSACAPSMTLINRACSRYFAECLAYLKYAKERKCDASSPPGNGTVGDCSALLGSGRTCKPTCNNGYIVSGVSKCSDGTLTAASCNPIVRNITVPRNPLSTCDASAAPANGAKGDCTATLASGKTCQPKCNSGYQVSGKSSCQSGTLTAATCAAKPCDASAAPANGAKGDCTATLASG